MHRRSAVAGAVRKALHLTLLRSPQMRAIYHFISQTMLRIPRLRLYITIYAGVALSLAISGILLLVIHDGRLAFRRSEIGLRSAIPILAFLIVIGIRTSMDAPVGLQGSWVFLVAHGRPLKEHLRAVLVWVSVVVSAVALATIALVQVLAPAAMRGALSIAAIIVLAIGMIVLLTKFFFLRIREIPFTTTRVTSTKDLPISFVRYMVVFPAFVLFVVDHELWVEASAIHLIAAVAMFINAYLLLGWMRGVYLKRRESDSAADDAVIVHRLGLQE